MSTSDSETRRNNILEAVIEVYLGTTLPVGSEAISRRMHQSLSSATIRNVLADLEREGLVEQPHTSAGRVPTDKGYRHYLNALTDGARLSPDESQRLADAIRFLRAEAVERQRLFERAGHWLAELSHQASVVLAPTVRQTPIKRIELVPIDPHRLLCVFVNQEEMVASHMVEVQEAVSRDEANSLVLFMNRELVGQPVLDVVRALERRLLAVNDSLYHMVKRSLGILRTAIAAEPEDRLLVDGTLYLFEQPEFQRDPQKTRELLRQLTRQQALLERMRADLAGADESRVRVGREVQVEGLEDCSYILSPVIVHHVVLGGVGVLGPRRMDYRRMQALVERMAGVVTEALS